MEPLHNLANWLYRSRRKIATLAILALAFPVAYHVVFDANGMMVYRGKRAESSNLAREILVLQQENARLGEAVKSLRREDKNTIEKEAREQLHYARPGEVVYAIPVSAPAVSSATASALPRP